MPFTGTGTGIQNANDVFFSGITDGNTLRYNNTTAKWNNVPLSIDSLDITDGAVTEPKLAVSNSPANGYVLSWNGSALTWVAQSGGGSGGYVAEVVVASDDAPISVKSNADYVCDGTADQTEINNAINDAFQQASGGPRVGVVLVGQFFDINDTIIMKAGITLRGLGMDTVIRAHSMGAVGMLELADKNHHMTTVRDLTLWGNYASGGSCHGIYYVQSDGGGDGNLGTYNPANSPDASHRFINLFIKAFSTGSRHGFYMGDNVRDVMVSMVRVADCSGNGFYMSGSSDGKYSQCIAIGCGVGWNVAGANNLFVECKASYTTAEGWILSSSRSQLTGCISQDAGTHGFNVSGVDVILTGCVADSNSRLSGSAYGLVVSANRTVIQGVHVYDRGQTPGSPQDRGINFTGSSNTFCEGMIRLASGSSYTSGSPTGYVRLWQVGSGSLYSVG